MPALTGALPRRPSSGCHIWVSLPRTRRPTPSRARSPGIFERQKERRHYHSSCPALCRASTFRWAQHCHLSVDGRDIGVRSTPSFRRLCPAVTGKAQHTSSYSGTTRQRRTRNPDAGTTFVSGFRVRGLRPRPGMTADPAFRRTQACRPPQLLNFTPVIASRLPCQIFSLSAFGMSMPSMMRKVSRVYIVPFSGSNGQSEANTILSRS